MGRIGARSWLGLSVLLGLAGCGVETSAAPVADDEAGSPASVAAIESNLTTPVSVSVPASQDTTVRASLPNQNFGSAKELDINRTLVKFDGAALAAAVGPSDVLVSAKFELTLTNNTLRRATAKREVAAFRVTKPWSERGATWNCADDANTSNHQANCPSKWSMGALPPNPWATPATSTITIAATQTGTASFDVTTDVKKFLSGALPNNGWMLKGSTPGEFAEFASRETATPPRLLLSVRRCSASLCDDGNACTADSCDATASCVHSAVANGTACNDGNACTSGDSCSAGACGAGAPVACQAVDACHPASCNPQSGACAAVNACEIYGVGSISGNATDGLALTPEVLEDGTPNNQVSAFGSAIAYTGVGNLYIATPDRGPHDGATSYADRYYLIDLSLTGGSVTPALVGAATLNQAPGVGLLGLNTAFDATNSPASRRFDPEGVRVGPNGSFFVSDEYGPFLYEFSASGDRLRVLDVPSRFLITHPALEAAELPPLNSSGRQANRGMEGLAISPNGSKLYGMMQNALIQDGALDAANKRVGLNGRILEIDTQTGATREFLYKLADKAYGVSEILAVNDHQFLVIERDSVPGAAALFKRLFLIDISGASDISAISALPVTDTPAGVTPVDKKPFLDLLDPAFGLAGASFPEKIEGLAFGPDLADGRHVLVVTNDNDGNALQANNFYVFAIAPQALPGFVAQQATFSSACVGVTCAAQGVCGEDGSCNPGSGQCNDAHQPAGTPCGADAVCDEHGACVSVPVHVVINEIESNGGTPDDWVELYNAGETAADISGYRFVDNDPTHVPYAIPAGTIIAPGGYYLLNNSGPAPIFGFGLGGADSATLFDPGLNVVDTYSWTAHAVTTYGRCPNGAGAFTTMTSSTKGAVNDCSVAVKINEVESNGGTPVDWIELYNAGPIAVDLSGYVVKDNDDTHAIAVAAGTTLAPGAFLTIETDVAGGFGLGGADSARLFTPAPALVLVDAYSWSAHATATYGRCPDGTGAFGQTASTKGSANACGGAPPPPPLPVWPGANTVSTVDDANTFGSNMSGLFYEPANAVAPATLWAVRNGPSTLFKLVASGALWTPAIDDGWSAGKTLRYPNGLGGPDSEGVTRGEYDEPFVYVATERDNENNGVSHLSVLRFDTSAAGAELVATHEWNLTADLPIVGSNLGLEGIAYYPDALLVAKGFRDESTSAAYDPLQYPDHGKGLFLVGIEANGIVYAYALDHAGAGGFQRVASFSSGNAAVMDVTLDRDVGYLWAQCDDTCGNQAGVLDIDVNPASATRGRFVVKKQFARPTTMANINNEGLAIAPESECASGLKAIFWSDDSQTDGHALRRDSIPCGAFVP